MNLLSLSNQALFGCLRAVKVLCNLYTWFGFSEYSKHRGCSTYTSTVDFTYYIFNWVGWFI